jgi:large subunit ribosomal protein L18
MSGKHNKYERRNIRRKRIRRRLQGTVERPRLSVFRSAKHIYAQVIDDTSGMTLVAASSRESDMVKPNGGGRLAVCTEVGKRVGERAKAKGVGKVCFDRGGYMYHGRVKALADGARSAGLEF